MDTDIHLQTDRETRQTDKGTEKLLRAFAGWKPFQVMTVSNY